MPFRGTWKALFPTVSIFFLRFGALMFEQGYCRTLDITWRALSLLNLPTANADPQFFGQSNLPSSKGVNGVGDE